MQIRTAITALAEAGLTVACIAAELKVHRSTVYRWRNGARRPNATNTTALRTLVEYLLAEATAAAIITNQRQVDALQRAFGALLTDAERAAEAALVASINATLDGPRSITTLVDPFALCADDLDAKLDALFPIAA